MTFEQNLRERVLVLDGAMGTMIQRFNLTENDFRGSQFAQSSVALKGCNDLLSLTRPDIIAGIHRAYIDAGADIIETNSFNANAISLAEYGLADRVTDINRAAARIAVEEARREQQLTGRKVYVAGSMGPGNVALSMPDSADDPHHVTFDSMAKAYEEQAVALISEGVDILLLETIFDTLNAKAAISGIKSAFQQTGRRPHLMVSVTLTQTGRTLSGQTLDAFVASIRHAGAISIGLNCGFGARDMEPYLYTLRKYGSYISIHPNAGLPDEMGRYVETPETMAATISGYLDRGLLNIVGGCCGTTPEHIKAIANAAHSAKPRTIPDDAPDKERNTLLLSGLEQLRVSPSEGFVKVGERCNVAGSRKFLRLINEKNYSEALQVATSQLEKGARILDINMDDGMLDTLQEMQTFVSSLSLDGTTASVPLMIDSSRIEVILAALKRIQGHPIVNSISLKEGEHKFLQNARDIAALGGTPIVMAFDETGQATTLQRRIDICRRAYRLLTEEAGLKGTDIIFDPNILTIATGIPEHDRYALDFLDAVSWIKSNLPGAKVSGGVSNLSFAFRGNNRLREAMHTVFLHHAIERGMDMAIVNPSTSLDISSVNPELRQAIEDVIFCRHTEATESLLTIASAMKEEDERRKASMKSKDSKQDRKNISTATNGGTDGLRNEMTLQEKVVRGDTTGLESLLEMALREDGSAMAVIKGRLMDGMNKVGEDFGAGRMFLPQVVRSAGVMKQAIAWLTPYIENEKENRADAATARVILATVKGDVHDIGKNIVAVVLRCSGFEVTDLGVMVDAQTIVDKAREINADFIGLSGLITPSLSEMIHVAERLNETGLSHIPLFVGGATTSALHTAVKIAPAYSGTVVHTGDAATLPDVMAALCDPERRDVTIAEISKEQIRLRAEYAARDNRSSVVTADIVTPEKVSHPASTPERYGVFDYSFSSGELTDLINWKAFTHLWQIPNDATGEYTRLLDDAKALLTQLDAAGIRISARAVLARARREEDNIVITHDDVTIILPTLRRESPPYLSLSDFIAPADDTVGLFAVTVGQQLADMIQHATSHDDYEALLLQSIADRLVEAATERLHTLIHTEVWGLERGQRSIRPAIGYPSLPDQSLVFEADKILDYGSMGIRLTENGALYPNATTTGLILGSPQARYFELGTISEENIMRYAARRGMTPERIRELLAISR